MNGSKTQYWGGDCDEVPGTSTLLREYVWMDGLPVAVIENGVTYYVRTDHIGRPVFATDSTGAKVWEVIYLPFGGVMTSTGTPIALRFPGQWFQSESGLHQNWMRDYDPTTGRYFQADPLGLVDGASVYGYAAQNPGRYTDPTGEAIPAFLLMAAAGAAIDFAMQYSQNDGRVECINPWQVAGAGLMGGGVGAIGRNIMASVLGRTALGARTAVNGLVGKTWTSRMSSMVYGTVSGRLRGVNGLVGSTKQLHHWAISQSSGLGRYLAGRGWGRAVMNSRWNLNPIAGGLNGRIGPRIFSRDNLMYGVPGWAKYGSTSGGAGAGMFFGSGGSGCGCE